MKPPLCRGPLVCEKKGGETSKIGRDYRLTKESSWKIMRHHNKWRNAVGLTWQLFFCFIHKFIQTRRINVFIFRLFRTGSKTVFDFPSHMNCSVGFGSKLLLRKTILEKHWIDIKIWFCSSLREGNYNYMCNFHLWWWLFLTKIVLCFAAKLINCNTWKLFVDKQFRSSRNKTLTVPSGIFL